MPPPVEQYYDQSSAGQRPASIRKCASGAGRVRTDTRKTYYAHWTVLGAVISLFSLEKLGDPFVNLQSPWMLTLAIHLVLLFPHIALASFISLLPLHHFE